MNTLRLAFGWLFLAGLTAAGTYYALDEVDQRGGLAGIDLHQKVGVVRYAAARPPIQNQTPPANNVTLPPSSQTSPPVNTTPPASSLVPPSNNITPLPNNQTTLPNQNTTRPYQNQTQPPQNVTPRYQRPPRYQAPPYQNQTPYRNPQPPLSQTQPPYSNANSPDADPRQPTRNQTQPYSNQPPQTQLPPDYINTQTRLVQVMNRANGLSRQYNTIRQSLIRQNLKLRPEQQAALGAMVQYTQLAQRALRSGDTTTSRQFMDEAERQMDVLEKLRDQ